MLVAKGLAAHSILLAVLGVPAVYLHSLVGSPPDLEGMVDEPDQPARSTAPSSTPTCSRDELDHDPRRRGMFEGLRALLAVRRDQPAFSPFGDAGDARPRRPRVRRARRGGGQILVCVTNVTGETVPLPALGGVDVLNGRAVDALVLGPYGSAWVQPA